MRIHIVEDNPDIQAIYTQLFTTAGHQVKTSSNGLDGITEMVEFQPDVVILDLMMPEMDGYEFLTALHNNTSMNPFVVVCSNLSQKADIDRALASGANTYLRKSDYVGADLVNAVQEAYATYRQATPTSAPAAPATMSQPETPEQY